VPASIVQFVAPAQSATQGFEYLQPPSQVTGQ
jgi:hypothetical protein